MINEHCTFQPSIIGDSPFVSERTLRDYAVRTRRRKPPPPPPSPMMTMILPSPLSSSSPLSLSRSRSKSPYPNQQQQQHHSNNQSFDTTYSNNNNNNNRSPSNINNHSNSSSGNSTDNMIMLSGSYDPTLGFRIGPPTAAGIPTFYFDKDNPPDFNLGYIEYDNLLFFLIGIYVCIYIIPVDKDLYVYVRMIYTFICIREGNVRCYSLYVYIYNDFIIMKTYLTDGIM